MRHLLPVLSLLMTIGNPVIAQQLYPATKSEVVASRNRVARGEYPRVAVDGVPCILRNLSVVSDGRSGHLLRFRFAEDCKGQREVELQFDMLEDAFEVKELLLDGSDYDSFNILPGRDGAQSSFELTFSPQPAGR